MIINKSQHGDECSTDSIREPLTSMGSFEKPRLNRLRLRPFSSIIEEEGLQKMSKSREQR